MEFSGTNPVTEKNHNISFNASHYTQEELWTKKHDFELEKCGTTEFVNNQMVEAKEDDVL